MQDTDLPLLTLGIFTVQIEDKFKRQQIKRMANLGWGEKRLSAQMQKFHRVNVSLHMYQKIIIITANKITLII